MPSDAWSRLLLDDPLAPSTYLHPWVTSLTEPTAVTDRYSLWMHCTSAHPSQIRDGRGPWASCEGERRHCLGSAQRWGWVQSEITLYDSILPSGGALVITPWPLIQPSLPPSPSGRFSIHTYDRATNSWTVEGNGHGKEDIVAIWLDLTSNGEKRTDQVVILREGLRMDRPPDQVVLGS